MLKLLEDKAKSLPDFWSGKSVGITIKSDAVYPILLSGSTGGDYTIYSDYSWGNAKIVLINPDDS